MPTLIPAECLTNSIPFESPLSSVKNERVCLL